MSPLRSKRHLNELLLFTVTLKRGRDTSSFLIYIFLNKLKSSCSSTLRLTLRCLAVGFHDNICQKSREHHPRLLSSVSLLLYAK